MNYVYKLWKCGPAEQQVLEAIYFQNTFADEIQKGLKAVSEKVCLSPGKT